MNAARLVDINTGAVCALLRKIRNKFEVARITFLVLLISVAGDALQNSVEKINTKLSAIEAPILEKKKKILYKLFIYFF